jgi:CubicO group peptidase (beta-lactamase class C family)
MFGKCTGLSSIAIAASLSFPGLMGALGGCGGKTDYPIVAPDGESPSLQSVLAFVEQQTLQCSIPGGAIAVVQNGKIVDQAGFGFKDPGGAPVDPTTLFLSTSLSKVVVGATALALVEEGKLDTSRPVTQYAPLTLAPGFDPSTITVGQLLAHTSGLPDLDASNLSCAVGPGQLGAWLAHNAQEPLWTPPGTVWDYSQRGYAAAGWVIESVSSQAFEDAVAQRVFRPAGMTTATYDPSTVSANGNYATGHEVNPVTGHVDVEPMGAHDCAVTRSTDGVYASVLDYAHLAETLLAGGGTMLSPASVKTLETGQANDDLFPGDQYTYGFYLHEGYKGLHMVRVDGDLDGYAATLLMVPDHDFAVVVFFDGYNRSTHCSTDSAAEFAASTYLGLTDVAGPDWLTPPSAWTPYEGTYVDPYVLGAIQVGFDGTSLTATTAKYGAVALTQLSATAFNGTFGSKLETVTFYPGASGPAQWFVTRLGVGQRQ